MFDLGKIIIQKDDLLQLSKSLKNVFNTFKMRINRTELLDKVENLLDIYYKINDDFINNYNMNKINYHKLKYLNYIKEYN